MKIIFLLAFSALVAFAQSLAQCEQHQVACTQIIHYTANIADYICWAPSGQPSSTITVSAISNANTGVMTATAHGFYYASGVTQKIVVFISGLNGNWTPLNGLHVLIPASANSFTTDVDTTAFGAVTGTIVVTTKAPRATSRIWSVQSLVADGSGNQTILSFAANSVSVTGTLSDLTSGTTGFVFACAAPASYQ